MKRALIATVFNESDNVAGWWGALQQQTVLPDEIVVVDGGSRDGTWEKLGDLARRSKVPVRLDQRSCNIAAGRNRAIALTDAEIIAATDAGSSPEAEWFGEITRPLLEDPSVDVVGGRSVSLSENEFQRYLLQFEGQPPEPGSPGEIYPSSRNIAFHRQSWKDIGGYPEWLTLTAEDALFNFQLHAVGKRFVYNPKAVVSWPVRSTARAYFKMLYSYGYGAAEARLYGPYFFQRGLITFCPLLSLLSPHRFHHLKFRYRKNASSTLGWLAGFFKGHTAPGGWKRVDGVLLSPEAQVYIEKKGVLPR